MAQTILIVDDEKDIVNTLKIYLQNADYNLMSAENGQQALEVMENNSVDLVLMDIMMPLMDGITCTRKIRETSNVPIILLTAKSEDGDKVLGLDTGADDYITKPFNPIEVNARIRSQLRRYTKLGGQETTAKKVCIGGIELDDETKLVTVDGEPVTLTPMEYSILKLLMTNAGKVFSSEEIYRRVWEETPIGSESTVAVHIRHLREKIEITPSEPRYLKVVWGHGYKMEKDHER